MLINEKLLLKKFTATDSNKQNLEQKLNMLIKRYLTPAKLLNLKKSCNIKKVENALDLGDKKREKINHFNPNLCGLLLKTR